jgi:hypothetical protein
MKIRCTQDSIRLRVRKSDVALLAKGQSVVEVLHFPTGGTLTFALEVSSVEHIQVQYEEANLAVHLPENIAQNWINTEQVGIETTLGQLHLLIEKDFPCAHRPHENKADTFEELT